MKSINFSSRIYEEMELKNNDINGLEQGIMKTLLEKYKPKAHCNTEPSSEKQAKRGFA